MSYLVKKRNDSIPHRRAPSHNLKVDARPSSLKWQLPGQTSITPATIISPPSPRLDDSTFDDSSHHPIRKSNSDCRRSHSMPNDASGRLLGSDSSHHRRRSSGCSASSAGSVQMTQSSRVDSVFDVELPRPGEVEKVDGELVVCSGALPAEYSVPAPQEQTIKDFTLPMQRVDTIDLQSVRCPRRRWREKTPAKFMVNVVATGRNRLRRHASPGHDTPISQARGPPQSNIGGHNRTEDQRDAEDLRRWLRTYGEDTYWGAIPFG